MQRLQQRLPDLTGTRVVVHRRGPRLAVEKDCSDGGAQIAVPARVLPPSVPAFEEGARDSAEVAWGRV